MALPSPQAGDLAVRGCGPGCIAAVTPAEMLRLSEEYRAAGRTTAADALLRALFDHPDTDIRLEARFRYARARIAGVHYADAIAHLERVLAERPQAGPVRLELARALQLSGDRARALRELARVRAGALPPDVARDVDRAVSTLRSARPLSGSVEIGIAPDSNANEATGASTIVIGGLPFRLDLSARRRPGAGVEGAAQLTWRRPLAGSTRLVLDLIGRGIAYKDPGLDDGVVQASVGPDFMGRFRPALTIGRRWYLGRGYSWSYGASAQWLHPISPTTVLDANTRLEQVRVDQAPALDGVRYSGSLTLEKALQPSLFGRASIVASRYDAQSAASSTTSAGGSLLLAKDLRGLTLYGQLGYTRLIADAGTFAPARRDDRIELSGGVSVRRIRIMGASPLVRVTHVRNMSGNILYDTRKTRVEIVLAHAF